MSKLNAVIARFKSETSDVADKAANTWREVALAATTLEGFWAAAEAYRRRVNACYVKSQLTAPDDWSYSRIYQLLDTNDNNMQLVIRFCNNAQRSPLSEVNPLGYVLVQSCKIRKIISMDQDARVITYNDGWTTYSPHSMPIWFMPKTAPDIHREAHLQHIADLLVMFKDEHIDPRNFDACVKSINETTVPRHLLKVYVDYIVGASGDDWRLYAQLVPLSDTYVAHCMAQAMFADVGTPNPFDYPSATVQGMGL